MKPVVVVAEAVNTVLAGQVGLSLPDLRKPEIVETELGGHVRLIVPVEQRTRARDVGPLREALAACGQPVVVDRV
jgi:hypothetical protein